MSVDVWESYELNFQKNINILHIVKKLLINHL